MYCAARKVYYAANYMIFVLADLHVTLFCDVLEEHKPFFAVLDPTCSRA